MEIHEGDVLRMKKDHKTKLYVLRINGHIEKAVCIVKGKGLKILSKTRLKKKYEKDPSWTVHNSLGNIL